MEESDFKKYSEKIDKLKEERNLMNQQLDQKICDLEKMMEDVKEEKKLMNQQLDQKIFDLEKKMEDEMKEKQGESSGGGKRKCEDTSTEAEERSVKKIRLDVDKESEDVKEEVEDQGLIEVC
ncbi:unnamed protein product [Meloidogyne enterolobii]|uniref:Uncharacterized protein n=1 Tax=Meloidogyne enterolobii TaxID=390850 RepID=A0ACB0YHN9_MELEN